MQIDMRTVQKKNLKRGRKPKKGKKGKGKGETQDKKAKGRGKIAKKRGKRSLLKKMSPTKGSGESTLRDGKNAKTEVENPPRKRSKTPKAKATPSGASKASGTKGPKRAKGGKARMEEGVEVPCPPKSRKAKKEGQKPKQERFGSGKNWVYLILEDQYYGCTNCRFIFGGCAACQRDSFRGRRAEEVRAEQQAALTSAASAGEGGNRKNKRARGSAP